MLIEVLRRLFLTVAIIIFFGAAGYLVSDFVTSARERNDLTALAQMVEWNTPVANNAPDAQQEMSATVQLARQELVAPAELAEQRVRYDQSDVEASWNAEKNAYPAVSALNDASGLIVDVQDYLQQTACSENQSIDMIQLVIMPIGTDDNAAVQDEDTTQEQPPLLSVEAQLFDCCSVRISSQQTLGDGIEQTVARYITNDETWIVQGEIIELDVYIKPATMLPQYELLYKQNSDIIGWIKIEGTQINYPVMQSPDDPQYYLRRNFKKEYAYSGLPFVDFRCDTSDPSYNLLIYGHNMKNGTQFGQLPKYARKAFWEQHQVFQFDLLYETRTYEIVSIFLSKQYKDDEKGFRYNDYIDLSEMDRFNEYIEQAKEVSIIDTGVEANWGDELLTLSTCHYYIENGTFVVVAKRIL